MKKLLLATILSLVSMLSDNPSVAQIAGFSPMPFSTRSITSAEEVNLIRRQEDPATGGGGYVVGSWKADVTFTGWTASPITFRYSFFSSPKFFYAHLRDGIEWFYGISATGDELYFSDIAVNNDYVYLLGSFSGELTVSDSEGRYYATLNSSGVPICSLSNCTSPEHWRVSTTWAVKEATSAINWPSMPTATYWWPDSSAEPLISCSIRQITGSAQLPARGWTCL